VRYSYFIIKRVFFGHTVDHTLPTTCLDHPLTSIVHRTVVIVFELWMFSTWER